MTQPTLSPQLEGADRAVAYFDHKRKAGERGQGGRWITIIKRGDRVDVDEHRSQAEAWSYVGLEGGNPSETYRPSFGNTDLTIAIG